MPFLLRAEAMLKGRADTFAARDERDALLSPPCLRALTPARSITSYNLSFLLLLPALSVDPFLTLVKNNH